MTAARRYPANADLEARARRRVPGFAWDYFIGGIGPEQCLARNRESLEAIALMPRYLGGAVTPDLTAEVMGTRYDLPFGVAPMGLGGMIWPGAAEAMAGAAAAANIPFALSSYANTSLERIAEIAPSHAWYQHYVTNRPEVEAAMLSRTEAAGYRTLIVTVDIPTATKRDRDIKNGLTIPVTIRPRMIAQVAACPTWALATARSGMPQFPNLAPYAPDGSSMSEVAAFIGTIMEGHVTPDRLAQIRDAWPGRLVVKGVLDRRDAEVCRHIGADAVVASNHGGRQLDAAPAAAEVLADLRTALGPGIALLADGGMRSGLDIARMLAAGADFVLLGRAFMMGVAALGPPGAAHVIETLREELRSTLAQLGCPGVADLPHFRSHSGSIAPKLDPAARLA
ncbi:MAG: alpha-hydroxy acid oxidase [Pseudomonadota bacterium]